MFLVGLTGGIGTGKSTVARYFIELGATVIDADIIARKVVEPGTPAWKKIKKEFGDEVLLENGEINRVHLGAIIFSDKVKRKALNGITHPYIHRSIAWEVLKYFFKGKQFVIMDLPLLFETNVFLDYLSKIIVVRCDEEQQLERIMDRNNFSPEEAQKRISAQMSLDQKCEKASFVIDNSGSIEETYAYTKKVYCLLTASRAQWRARLVFFGWLGAILAFIGWIYFQIPSNEYGDQ